LKLSDGGVAERFGALAVGDVAVVERDAFVGGDDMDINPYVERRVEVFDALGDAGLHDVPVRALKIGADGFWKELPMGFGVDVGGLEPTDASGFGVGVRDGPVGVTAEDRFWELRNKTRQVVVLGIALAPKLGPAIEKDRRFI
jgi:hypothetical protein